MTAGNDTRRDTRAELLGVAERVFAHKGYASVGINEVLTSASVPKGSFYHYFASKDAFGEAVLERYFEVYLRDMDELMSEARHTWAARLDRYWDMWRTTQSLDDCQGRCLAVKLGAEVADLSDAMRLVLKAGTTQIVDRLERALLGGAEDGSIPRQSHPRAVAEAMYELWLGASVMAKIQRDLAPLDSAQLVTQRLLGQ
jgi:TetR/AcrR family transcriptional regulator, transcriptional repressor for nem operon